MSLIIDGTTISTSNYIKIDNINIEKVVFDGVTVWQKYTPTWKTVWSGSYTISLPSGRSIPFNIYTPGVKKNIQTQIYFVKNGDTTGAYTPTLSANDWYYLFQADRLELGAKQPIVDNNLPCIGTSLLPPPYEIKVGSLQRVRQYY